MPSKYRILLLATLTFILSACGGGGGGGGGQASSSAPVSPVVAETSGTVSGTAVDYVSGLPLVNASVSVGNQSVKTGLDGSFVLKALPLSRTVATVSAAGYADYSKIVNLNANQTKQSVTLEAVPVGSSLTFDPSSTQKTTDSASLASATFPANAFANATGAAPTGSVTVQMTLLNGGSKSAHLPGDYSLANGNLQVFGAVSVDIKDSLGNVLNLALGKTALLEIPVVGSASNLPNQAPLFAFNAQTGRWVQEGAATLKSAAGKFYYEGSVSHFSTWAVGIPQSTILVTGKVVDETGKAFAGVTVSTIAVDDEATYSAVTDAAGNFSVPIKAGVGYRVFAYLNNAKSFVFNGVAQVTNSSLPDALVLPSAATATLSLGPPKVLPGDTAHFCCKFFKAEIPFTASGVEIKPFANNYHVEAGWEFTATAPLCERPALGEKGKSCSDNWMNSGHEAPYLNPWNGWDWDIGGYVPYKVGSTGSTTAGTLGFQFSFHNTKAEHDPQPTRYVVVAPNVTVLAVLTVTVYPKGAPKFTVRSGPVSVAY